MGKDSSIQWTDHTINFWWGCTKVSPACANCYAENMAAVFGKRLFGKPVIWGPGEERSQRLEAATAEAIKLNRKAHKLGIRYRVFANSMSDWLDEEVPRGWVIALLDVIRKTPHLDWQLLTKRPQNFESIIKAAAMLCEWPKGDLINFIQSWLSGKPPENVWIGITAEDQLRLNLRLELLLQIPAKVRFLSCEPLLEEVRLPYYGNNPLNTWQDLGNLHWIICGGESGSKSRPVHPWWVKALKIQCYTVDIPFFFKQWGEWLPCGERTLDDLPPKLKGVKHADGTLMLRAGTKAAGNYLDGIVYEQFPRVDYNTSEVQPS